MARPYLHESVKNNFWRALNVVFDRVKAEKASNGDANIMVAAVKELIHEQRGASQDVYNNTAESSDALDLSDLEADLDNDGTDGTEDSNAL